MSSPRSTRKAARKSTTKPTTVPLFTFEPEADDRDDPDYLFVFRAAVSKRDKARIQEVFEAVGGDETHVDAPFSDQGMFPTLFTLSFTKDKRLVLEARDLFHADAFGPGELERHLRTFAARVHAIAPLVAVSDQLSEPEARFEKRVALASLPPAERAKEVASLVQGKDNGLADLAWEYADALIGTEHEALLDRASPPDWARWSIRDALRRDLAEPAAAGERIERLVSRMATEALLSALPTVGGPPDDALAAALAPHVRKSPTLLKVLRAHGKGDAKRLRDQALLLQAVGEHERALELLEAARKRKAAGDEERDRLRDKSLAALGRASEAKAPPAAATPLADLKTATWTRVHGTVTSLGPLNQVPKRGANRVGELRDATAKRTAVFWGAPAEQVRDGDEIEVDGAACEYDNYYGFGWHVVVGERAVVRLASGGPLEARAPSVSIRDASNGLLSPGTEPLWRECLARLRAAPSDALRSAAQELEAAPDTVFASPALHWAKDKGTKKLRAAVAGAEGLLAVLEDPRAHGVPKDHVEEFFRIAFQLCACVDVEAAESIAERALAEEDKAPPVLHPGAGGGGRLRWAALWILARASTETAWSALFDAVQKAPILTATLLARSRHGEATVKLSTAIEACVDRVPLRTIGPGELGNWTEGEYELNSLLKALVERDPRAAKALAQSWSRQEGTREVAAITLEMQLAGEKPASIFEIPRPNDPALLARKRKASSRPGAKARR